MNQFSYVAWKENSGGAAVAPAEGSSPTPEDDRTTCALCTCSSDPWADPFCECVCHYSPEGVPPVSSDTKFRQAALEAFYHADVDVSEERVAYVAGILKNLASGFTEGVGVVRSSNEPTDDPRPASDRDEYRPITLEAHGMVFGDRQADYGHPIDDFDRTAAYWTTHLGDKLVPGAVVEGEDVGPMMILLKVSRQRNRRKRDNMTDTAGYAETTERVIHERARRAALEGLETAYSRNAHLRQIMDGEVKG